jgi:hypothetical protein
MGHRTVYDAERILDLYADEALVDIKALQRRHARIMQGKRFRAAFPHYATFTPRVERGSGGGSYAHLGVQPVISLGGNRSESTLLHEMAHVIAHTHSRYGRCPDHGAGFVAALLDVTRVVLGTEAERALKYGLWLTGLKTLDANGKAVKVRKVTPKPEWEARMAWLTKAREQRKAAAVIKREMRAAGASIATGDEVACSGCGQTLEVRQEYDLKRSTNQWVLMNVVVCHGCGEYERWGH